MKRRNNKILDIGLSFLDFNLATYEMYFAFRHIFEYIHHFLHAARTAFTTLNIFLSAVDLPMLEIP